MKSKTVPPVVAGFLAILAVFTLGSSQVFAQATRTWVSGVGDDANPGSRTAPCKTFAGAISKTAAGGEINAIDPGGFGTLTITKAITVDGGGTFASVLAAGTNGFNISAGVNDVVTLRNLSINGASTGIDGIKINSCKALHIENCVIFGFSGKGIDGLPTNNCALYVKNTVIRNCAGGGVLLKPGAGFNLPATFSDVLLNQNFFGVRAEDRTTGQFTNSAASGNTNNGFLAVSSSTQVLLTLQNCVATGNNPGSVAGGGGIVTQGAAAAIRIADSVITYNFIGLSHPTGAIVSLGNNTLLDNVTNGTPSGTVLPQ